MALFVASGATYQVTAPGSGSTTEVFNTLGPSGTGIASGTVLQNLTLVNVGSVPVYLGSSTVTAATGLVLDVGQSLTIVGSEVAGSGSKWNVYGITSSGTGAIEAGLASFPSVI